MEVRARRCLSPAKKTVMDFKKKPKIDFKDIDKLSKREAKKEIEALREGIEYHNHLYYVRNRPEISDALYDKLFKRLQELEEAFPQYRSDASPTRRVGAPPAKALKRVEHTAPMLSLNAAIEEEQIRDWFDFVQRNTGKKKLACVVEPKFDGVSVEIVYENGELKYGATRGDGRTGEEISANLKTVRTIPLKLQQKKVPGFLAVRGEVFLPKEAFQELNRRRVGNGEEPFANPRNACAGTIRRLESRIVARWPLDVFFYEILKIKGESFESHWDELKAFGRWGLKTDPLNQRFSDFEQVAAYREKLTGKRDKLPYEIDGIVIKLDELELREKLGTRHRSPRWAVAWKFPPREEVTVLERIVVQVGASGILTPVALLQPVDVGGVTVSRATLHNEREVKQKDLRESDVVRVVRAGDVIPEVLERAARPNRRAGKFEMPGRCPSCGTRVIREGAYVLCPAGLSCPAQLKGRIRHYGSRDALDIEGLGEETAGMLVAQGLVKSLADLYRLAETDILRLEGFAEKSARQLRQAVQKTKKPRLDRFLYALDIRHVGQRVAQILARNFSSLDELRKAGEKDLEKIPGIGPEIARSVADFFAQNENVLRELEKAGIEVRKMPARKGKRSLEGKIFVFTGALEAYTRDEAQRLVEELGGRATSSVSGSTDYLVAGETPGSKLEEAKKRKVKIIDEKTFKKLIAEAT